MNGVEFQQYRSFLFAIAYRMIGSVTDAEDMVQETFLRWQQRRVTMRSPKAYLATIVNGQSALVNYADGCLHSTMTFEMSGDRIGSIFAVVNPEKLKSFH